MLGINHSPMARYSETLDLAQVLDHFLTDIDNDILFLLSFCQKMVTMSTLTKTRRCGEIASISSDSVHFSKFHAAFGWLRPRKT